MRPLRLISDNTAIPFMRGRYVGVATSAVLLFVGEKRLRRQTGAEERPAGA
ncbi:MAG: hypothetical protein JWO51_283 [Rhodospirillales bacterium]|nr:hypothetical protein [Rhodospirillales bacterium]